MTRLAVVAAGGTGGHLFPAEALAKALQARGWKVVLATDVRGAQFAGAFPAEERLALEAATFRKGYPIGMARAGLRIALGVLSARKAYRRLQPAVVVGFGGYPSLPALLAARQLKIPTVIHEQNAVLGRVNRYLAPKADAVASAFPTLLKADLDTKAKVQAVGNPVRPDIRALADAEYVPFDPRGKDTIRLLVTGGSQGARLLSDCVPDAVAMLPEALRLRLRVEQQTRSESLERAREVYAEAGVEAEIAPFFRDMAGKLAKAHLVIGRAGASTVCELAVAGRPAILVPLAIAADDHQRYNAKLLTDAGAAVVIKEDELTAARLAEVLRALLSDPAGLQARSMTARMVAEPDAAERLADLVEKTAR
jgi:UDP-N-acetylglucosamine--N-acetylmuramyl-(pentapeptide) pyrophosphoryl-undecaprenol N-acetylglucosamine transferase